MIHIYIGGAILVLIGYFLLKYLDGSFTFKEEILKQRPLIDNEDKVKGFVFIIKRVYNDGRIEIKTKEI